MNHWIVSFDDAAKMQEIRAGHFGAHLDYLTSHTEIFVDGASLALPEGSPPCGGIWIVKSDNQEDVIALIDGDPMYRSGHRKFKIYTTGKTFST